MKNTEFAMSHPIQSYDFICTKVYLNPPHEKQMTDTKSLEWILDFPWDVM
jgi:hypothetical protein